MTGREIVEKVKALNLPENSYIVFGSGPLAAVGIREAGDIDMYVTPEVLNSFIKAGWNKFIKALAMNHTQAATMKPMPIGVLAPTRQHSTICLKLQWL